ncbi:MAG: sugar phosphate isomerase/epimerase [Bacteroidota bacterium]|nr:sugar phosphate isomerase/epimerase [Bacteroidota bacterium]
MEVNFFCPRWGSEGLSWDDFIVKAKSAGFDGIEIGLPHDISFAALDEIWNLAAKYSMLIIPQHYDTYEANFQKHKVAYSKWFEKLKPFPAMKINSQTGKDFFSFEQNYSLIKVAEKFTEEKAIPVFHETHRNKFSFAAHITKEYLTQISSLQLTLDISHWVCVAESFLEDQTEAVDLAITRTEHLHCRVGYTEGPQVPDPRITLWQQALQAHLKWWDQVAARKNTEKKILTITPEFGSFPYMVPLPQSDEPICNQWDVNVYMMNLLKERYC